MASPVRPNEPLARFAFSPAAQHLLMSEETRNWWDSIGSLEKLPKEIILQILDKLDLQSLFRLSLTCFEAWRLVKGFQPYREISKHTPKFPYTLAATNLLKKYSALHIFSQIILSDRCSSCSCFGVYVFLPACERVCRPCFLEKIAFQMIPIDEAKELFELRDEQIASRPFFYSTLHGTTFVSVQEAQEIANRPLASVSKLHLEEAHPKVSSAAVHLPFPSKDGPDGGYHCFGCVALSGLALVNTLSPQQVYAIHPMSDRQAMDGGLRIYAKSEIMAHVQQCLGVKAFLKLEMRNGD